jgi:hypothetical protein
VTFPPVGSLVQIVWEDAVSPEGGWQHPDELDPALRTVTTVGFLVTVTDKLVGIAQDTDSLGNVNGVGVIPTGCIVLASALRESFDTVRVIADE